MELAIVFEGHKIYFAEEYDPHECETVRAAVVNLPADAKLDAAACSWWAKVLRQYPVSCSQVVLKRPDGRQECRLKYNYYRLGDEGDPAITAAPVPMLASFAMEHRFPGLEVPNAKETGYRSQYAAYRVVEGTDTLTYIAPPVDRAKVMKGVGELFAKRDEKSNTHAWGDEAAMFRRMADWGFDHCRYAFAFQADWDLPLCRSMAGPILEDNEAMWNRLDQVVKRCNDAGMQMMLTWFSDTGTRRWKDYPAEQRNCYELWRRIARRYSHLPDWAVSYDFFNEPAQMNTGHFNQVMKELTAVVRSEDKRHLIVWESGDGWAQPHWCLWMQPVKDDNVLYSFHHYGKHWGYAYDEYYPGYQATRERTQIEPWLEAILFSIKHNVPIHCGEFGLSMIQPAGDGEQWLDDYLALFERFGIGWNWWNYSGQDIYRTGLIARDRLSPYVPILTRWCRRSGWGQTRRAAARKK
jgi:endoglucanase